MKESITEQFIELIFKLTKVKLETKIYHRAKSNFIDYLGVTFAGNQMLQAKTDQLYNDICPEGSGEAVLIGSQKKANILEAALINGINSHAAELDDGERFGMLHPGAPIFSALLPIVQKYHISDRDFLKGVVIGYEVAIRLGRSLQPSLKDKGFHCTSVCGSIGAAIAVGVALNFTKKQLNDTLSAAATSSSGLLKVIKGRSELKPFNIGIAAQNGLRSALLVKSGFEGPSDVLDGDMGFLKAYSDKFDIEQLLSQGDPHFAIMDTYLKPYAACRHCHPPIEAAISIRNKYNIKAKEVKSIDIYTYYWAVGGHDHKEIPNINSAKMSIPYSVAVAIHTGAASICEFSDNLINSDPIKQLTKKINVHIDKELTALVPKKRGAIVKIKTENNTTFVERVDLPKGEPETPLTFSEITSKFLQLCMYANFDSAISQQIIENIMSDEVHMTELFCLIQKGKNEES